MNIFNKKTLTKLAGLFIFGYGINYLANEHYFNKNFEPLEKKFINEMIFLHNAKIKLLAKNQNPNISNEVNYKLPKEVHIEDIVYSVKYVGKDEKITAVEFSENINPKHEEYICNINVRENKIVNNSIHFSQIVTKCKDGKMLAFVYEELIK